MKHGVWEALLVWVTGARHGDGQGQKPRSCHWSPAAGKVLPSGLRHVERPPCLPASQPPGKKDPPACPPSQVVGTAVPPAHPRQQAHMQCCGMRTCPGAHVLTCATPTRTHVLWSCTQALAAPWRPPHSRGKCRQPVSPAASLQFPWQPAPMHPRSGS